MEPPQAACWHNFPNEEAFVEGVAPGAELVPLRVDKNVYWIFSGANDAKAIDRGVEIGCHVISMSRSGTDQEVLRNAIASASARGLIVVAAAGNCNFGCKIFSPANYEKVICAAGNTFDRKPWSESSRGPEVTMSAPAHSVYRARAFKNGGDYGYSAERSSGTSYATPIIAGAAALWLELHGGTEAIAQKVGGLARVPVVFKHLLKTTGFQTGTDWDTTKYGPGILDCVKLLSAPLPRLDELSAIEQATRTKIRVGRVQMRDFIDKAILPGTDGRAASLLALELETAEFQQPISSLLRALQLSADTLIESELKSSLKDLDISEQLRSVLSRLH